MSTTRGVVYCCCVNVFVLVSRETLFAFQCDPAVTIYLLQECLVLQYFIDFLKYGSLYSLLSPPPLLPLNDCRYYDVKNRFNFYAVAGHVRLLTSFPALLLVKECRNFTRYLCTTYSTLLVKIYSLFIRCVMESKEQFLIRWRSVSRYTAWGVKCNKWK
jgi:hypothetical protein